MEDESTVSTPDPEPIGRWCLVANVVDEREWGPEHELRPGTKHLSSGAKVYCDFPISFGWDAEFGRLPVLGHHRGSKRFVCIVVKAQWLHNFRVKCEYSPQVRRLLDETYRFSLGGYTEEARLEAERQVQSANRMVAQVREKRDSRKQ